MDQWSGRIGVALIALVTAAVWWWALTACRAVFTRPGALPSLILLVTAAAYLCVPETDQFKGVALLVVGIGLLEVTSREVLPAMWHGALLAVVLWAGLFGATGRGSAVVGAVFAGWVIVLPALGMAVTSGSSPRTHIVVACGAAAASVPVARPGALATTVRPALAWSVAAASGSALMALLLLRRGRPPHHSR